jgi:hypothetical protein
MAEKPIRRDNMNLIYVMDNRSYWQYRKGKKDTDKMTHNELIQYINDTFGLRGTVVKIRVNS